MIYDRDTEKRLADGLTNDARRIAVIKDQIEALARPHASGEEIDPTEHAFYALRDRLDEALDLIDRVIEDLSSYEDRTLEAAS